MPPFRKHLKGPANKSAIRGPRRKAFHSSRLAQQQDVDEDTEQNIQVEAPESVSNDEVEPSSEEEDEIPAVTINPYNALLQSLHAQDQSERHRRKRRKLEAPEVESVSDETRDTVGPGDDGLQDELEDEEEEQPVEEDPEEVLSDDDEAVDDPFKKHVDMDEHILHQSIQEIKKKSSVPAKVDLLKGWKTLASGPIDCPARRITTKSSTKSTLSSFKVKDKIRQQAEKHSTYGLAGTVFARPILENQDILFCGRTHRNAKSFHETITVHVLDYVLKTRDRILKNTTRLAKNEGDDLPDLRDQGFTRPKVLFLLPTRQACYRLLELIVTLYEPEQQENRKRFDESFSRKEDDVSDDKPEDFRELFGGNDDDLFRLGLKFTRKTIKFFSQFYASDIIFASPLGLRMAMSKKDSKKEDYDFLSSIELVVVDQADALLQQNWEHVEHIFNHLNLQPKEHHGCDFSRVRNWYLDGNAKYLRQTIVLSSYLTPELNQLCSQHMQNVEGTLKITPESFDGAIVNLGISIKQTFARFDASLPQKEPDARFKAFTTTMLPTMVKLLKSGSQSSHGILLFVPSYMDFVRIRNFLATSTAAQDIPFGTISEYTSSSDVARARSHFVSGRHSVLLYSGRAHHYKRYKLKGVKRVFMYALPDNPTFYTEVAGGYLARSISEGLIAPEDANVRSLFCKWDVLKLERTVGTKRVGAMLQPKNGEVFDFV